MLSPNTNVLRIQSGVSPITSYQSLTVLTVVVMQETRKAEMGNHQYHNY